MSNSDIKQRVRHLLDETDKTHRYSMSGIYTLYNEVFDRNETPQSCASCLIRKARELRRWLESQEGCNTTNQEDKT
ncbi:hypothetical protein [Dysgonomonas sp. 511]|uniref:hypothetical protein n=1 Tax=Dysgonomonas sp. 511 TaxID=2302930 RepID=UPI0013D58E61|nr:hypothetical protein [Dysgonomonas sp. 511]NDV79347.1 hypothetical protein [Dysgonomonas sp. 511]